MVSQAEGWRILDQNGMSVQSAQEAKNTNKWDDWSDEAYDILESNFPDATFDMLEDWLDEAKRTLGKKETTYIDDWNNLGKIFFYEGTPLTLNKFLKPDFTASKVKLRTGWDNYVNSLPKMLADVDNLETDIQETEIKNRLNRLIKKVEQIEAGAKPVESDITDRLDFGWAEEVGDLPVSRWNVRETIYDYWEDVHGRYDKVNETYKEVVDLLDDDWVKGVVSLDPEQDDFVDAISDMSEVLEYFGYEEKEGKSPQQKEEFKSFFNKAKQLQSWSKKNANLPKYVYEFLPFELRVGGDLELALNIMEKYYEIKGVGLKDIPKTPEDKEITGGRAGETMQSYSRLINDIKIEGDKLLVDPIFWYNHHQDYSKLKLPKEKLAGIESIIFGDSENWPILDDFVDEDDLDEFEEWLDSYHDEVDERPVSSKQDYYLPVSDFITSDYKGQLVVDGKQMSSDKLVQDEDKILELLTLVAEMSEDIKTAFTVYQKEQKQQSRTGDKGALLFNMMQYPASLGIETSIPAQFQTAWQKFIEALNDYYLWPTQQRYFVQAKQKPVWVTGHAGLITSLKGSENNPIGSILQKVVDNSLLTIDHLDIKSIREFIELAKDPRPKTSNLITKGREASEALDDLFGERWSDENKESIAYIIKDVFKTKNLVTRERPNLSSHITSKANKRYWENIDELADKYTKKGVYPINALRTVLELPEFNAWFSTSQYRSRRGGEKQGIFKNTKLTQEIKRLEETFEDFVVKMDEVNFALLLAHDTIRKMQGREIIKSRLSLNKIEDMDTIINKIHVNHNMDLTATEVDKIVKAVASYESLARNYGVTEEVVYTIKAMFR